MTLNPERNPVPTTLVAPSFRLHRQRLSDNRKDYDAINHDVQGVATHLERQPLARGRLQPIAKRRGPRRTYRRLWA